MFSFAYPEQVSLVFSFFVIGSNLLSNVTLGRSTYSLFFLQMAYQLSHAYRDANNFTKLHRWSFFDFVSAYDCFDYSKCQFATYSGIGCSLILIIASTIALRSKGQINTLIAKRSCGVVFLVVLSGFEWVHFPSISSLLYLDSAFSEKAPIVLGFIAIVLSLIGVVISVHALRKKFRNEIGRRDDTYFEKVMISLLFTSISITNFAISKGAIFTQGVVFTAAYLLIVISVLIYKRSNKGGWISQIRNANLGLQAICFLCLASMLENNQFADNLFDSIITVSMIALDALLIMAEIALELKREDGCEQEAPYAQRQIIAGEVNRRLGANTSIASQNFMETPGQLNNKPISSRSQLQTKVAYSSRQKHLQEEEEESGKS